MRTPPPSLPTSPTTTPLLVSNQPPLWLWSEPEPTWLWAKLLNDLFLSVCLQQWETTVKKKERWKDSHSQLQYMSQLFNHFSIFAFFPDCQSLSLWFASLLKHIHRKVQINCWLSCPLCSACEWRWSNANTSQCDGFNRAGVCVSVWWSFYLQTPGSGSESLQEPYITLLRNVTPGLSASSFGISFGFYMIFKCL